MLIWRVKMELDEQGSGSKLKPVEVETGEVKETST